MNIYINVWKFAFTVHLLSVYTHLRIYFALTYQLVRRIHARRRRPHARRSLHQPYLASVRLWVSLQEYEINERIESGWKAELILQMIMLRTSRSNYYNNNCFSLIKRLRKIFSDLLGNRSLIIIKILKTLSSSAVFLIYLKI